MKGEVKRKRKTPSPVSPVPRRARPDGFAIHGVVVKTSETSRFLAGVMKGWHQFQNN
jgi:hypothetical protein